MNPSTSFTYVVPGEGGEAPVIIEIFDTAGRLVRELVNEPRPAGTKVLRHC